MTRRGSGDRQRYRVRICAGRQWQIASGECTHIELLMGLQNHLHGAWFPRMQPFEPGWTAVQRSDTRDH